MVIRILLAVTFGGLAILSLTTFAAHLLNQTGERLMERAEAAPEGQRARWIEEAGRLFAQADRLEPWDPEHIEAWGNQALERVWLEPLEDERQSEELERAGKAYARAVHLHPLRAKYQMLYGWSESMQGSPERARAAVNRALRLYPRWTWVWYQATHWYLANLPNLDDEGWQRAQQLVRRGVEAYPRKYLELCWKTVADPAVISRLLPEDPTVRQLFLRQVTALQYFPQRWDELEEFPELRQARDEEAVYILLKGKLTSRQGLLAVAQRTEHPWQGLEEGWLSATLTATTKIHVPAGEALVVIPMRGQAVEEIWPEVRLAMEGSRLARWSIQDDGEGYWFLLLETAGGEFPLEAVVTNGEVVYRNDEFYERRVALGPIRILTPEMVRDRR